MRNRWAVPAAALAAIATFSALQATGLGESQREVSATQTAPDKARVLVKDNYFEPRSTEVVEGAQVTWKWRGENRHSIRFTRVPEGAARKGASIRAEGRWRRKFHRPGVYRYVCKVWAGMRGSVTVRPEEPPPPQ
jgi:plastocyanin